MMMKIKKIQELVKSGKLVYLWVSGSADTWTQLVNYYINVVGIKDDHVELIKSSMADLILSFTGAGYVPIFTNELLDRISQGELLNEIDQVNMHSYIVMMDKKFVSSLTPVRRKSMIAHEVGHVLDFLERGEEKIFDNGDPGAVFEAECQAWAQAYELTNNIDKGFMELALDSYRMQADIEMVNSKDQFEMLLNDIKFWQLEYVSDMFLIAEDEYDLGYTQTIFDDLLADIDKILGN